MASDQYSIPGSSIEAQQVAPLVVPDIAQPTPEIQPTPFGFIKDIETRLDSYRETALAIEEAKRPLLRSLKSLIITPKPPLAELIEKESIIGGHLFEKQDANHDVRFWEEGNEWFMGYSDGKNVAMVDSTIHYQVTENSMKKSYQGRVVSFAPNEESIFVEAVKKYETAVIHELYPFDEVLEELKKDQAA